MSDSMADEIDRLVGGIADYEVLDPDEDEEEIAALESEAE